MKPVLVLVTADTCGHCVNFKKNELNNLKQALQNEDKVYLIEINLPNTQSTPGIEYHPDCKKYIGWYPTFLLFSGSTWFNHNVPLKGSILNGKFKDDQVIHVGGYKMLTNNIIDWINQELSSNPIFNEPRSSVVLVNNDNKTLSSKFIDNKKLVPTSGKRLKIVPRDF